VARRPLEREGVSLDGGRRTTQLMRDSLDGATNGKDDAANLLVGSPRRRHRGCRRVQPCQLTIVIYAMAGTNILTLPKAEQAAAVTTYILDHGAVYAVLAVLGTLCSVLGGYVAAVMARRSEVLNGALSSYLCLGVGIWALAKGQEQMPTWLFLLLLPLSPIVSGLGGYLRLRQTRARAGVTGPVLPSGAV
jgi:hypothetical protein